VKPRDPLSYGDQVLQARRRNIFSSKGQCRTRVSRLFVLKICEMYCLVFVERDMMKCKFVSIKPETFFLWRPWGWSESNTVLMGHMIATDDKPELVC